MIQKGSKARKIYIERDLHPLQISHRNHTLFYNLLLDAFYDAVVRAQMKFFKLVRQEWAVIRIQMAFRGNDIYMAVIKVGRHELMKNQPSRMGSSPNYTLKPLNSFEWCKTTFGVVTSIGIHQAKAPNPSRLSKTWQSFKHPKNSSIPSNPDRAHIFTINGAIQPDSSTPPHIPNVNTNERPPVTTTMFAATTPGNTPFAYRASTLTDPTPMISPTFYFSEDYDEEREMEPRPEQTREVTPPLRTRSPRVSIQHERVVGFEEVPNREGSRTVRNIEGNRPSDAGAEENGRREMNLPSLLAAHLGRNKNGQPLQSWTSVHGGRQSSINIGGNLPPNGTLLSHHAQPFIPSSAHVPNGFVPTHVNLYSQPYAGIINGQTPSFPFQAQTGNPSVEGTSIYPPQRGYIPQTFPNSNVPLYNRSAYPVATPTNNYPFYTQPMYAQPNMPMCPNPYPAGLFAYPTGSVTPFVRWIEDYPLLDGLKMPSHVGSYDGKGDPDNFLHLFEGAIRMHKWLVPVSCHMFTYTLKDSARIWWNSQKAASNKEKAIVSELSPLGDRKVEKGSPLTGELITDCSPTYLKVQERFSPWKKYQRLLNNLYGCPEVSGEWKDERRNAKPAETPVLMISRRSCNPRKRYVEEDYNKVREITFPPLSDKSSADPVIIKAYVSGRQVNRVYMDIESSTAMQQMGIMVSTIHGSIKFHMPKGIDTLISENTPQGQKKQRIASEARQEDKEDILNCVDAEEKIMVNDQNPEQTITIGRQLQTKTKLKLQELLKEHTDIFAWTTAHMTGVPRTIMVGGEIFNTEHRVNESKHVEPIK
ncbi:hypothetical protein Tco_1375329 [Tanacetum coccineum]